MGSCKDLCPGHATLHMAFHLYVWRPSLKSMSSMSPVLGRGHISSHPLTWEHEWHQLTRKKLRQWHKLKFATNLLDLRRIIFNYSKSWKWLKKWQLSHFFNYNNGRGLLLIFKVYLRLGNKKREAVEHNSPCLKLLGEEKKVKREAGEGRCKESRFKEQKALC